MAASAQITVGMKLIELGSDLPDFVKKFTITATPARFIKHYMIQAVANTAEVLPIGDVGTVEVIVIHCVSNDVDIDTTYVSSFNAEIEVQENEWQVFKPKGILWFKNDDADELSTIEYWVLGTA